MRKCVCERERERESANDVVRTVLWASELQSCAGAGQENEKVPG